MLLSFQEHSSASLQRRGDISIQFPTAAEGILTLPLIKKQNLNKISSIASESMIPTRRADF